MTGDNVDRRSFLKLAGGAAATASLAGCAGDGGGEGTDDGTGTGTDGGGGSTMTEGGDETETQTEQAEPETREEYLQRANQVLHDEAPWIFLNRQYSVYGKSNRIEWEARRDERIDAYEITPTEGSDVRITQSQLDSGLDPHDHRETPTDNIVLQSYEGLLSRDAEGNVTEALSNGYERVEDGRVRFMIREGVTFHSGEELTPADVAFSVNRIVQENIGGLVSPQSDQLAGVTSAEVVDGERAVDVVSEGGINPIVFSLFATYCDIVQQQWIEDNDSATINSDMNGTGPFQLDSYDQGVSVSYTRYEDYWREPAPAETLEITNAAESSTRVNQLLGGETDIIVNVPPQDAGRVQNSGDTSLSAVPSTRVIYNAMVYNAEPFDSVQFRQAMNYAIDLPSIIENILSGFADPTGQPTLEGFVGYNSDVGPYEQNVEQAQQLVEESGYSGAEITLHTPVGRYLRDLEIAQAVAGQIDELENVSASVEQREFGQLAEELLDGDISTGPSFYLIGWGNATFDASQTIIPLLTTDGALTSYSNEEVDGLIESAQSMGGSDGGSGGDSNSSGNSSE
ncbi:ABC transporter substrate-binding protein [Halomarina oriensis]|uniref:Peptide ABC transporter substrate-binding protein n=1 Tax=Halomarina oriensis TaxID=671145 RepID=A0A6B0GM51_9EURY|nr:ABC transporter substrate-binding protein [Halomarina oriensis]MWG35932.1 peptide ABC transporter substrate-binding protein [Halomarina oriensis]